MILKKIKKRKPSKNLCETCKGKRKKWRCVKDNKDKCPSYEEDKLL